MNERGGRGERVSRCHLLQVLLSSCGDGDTSNSFLLKADIGDGRGYYMTGTEEGEGGREGR